MTRKKKEIRKHKILSPSSEPVESRVGVLISNLSPETAPAESGTLPEAQTSENFPIVGIGASAGGLAAFEAFFSGMPANTDPGMAFVLVQNLALDH